MLRHRVLTTLAAALGIALVGATSAVAAPPVCTTEPTKQVRTDTMSSLLVACGWGPFPPRATVTITDPPDHGSALGLQGFPSVVLHYLPASGYTGPDSVTYTVTTEDGTSAPVTQQYNVADAVNATPTCQGVFPANPRIRRESTRTFLVSCMDADGDPVTVSVDSPAGHAGVVVSNDPSGAFRLTITPIGSYTGSDSFSIKAFDGRAYGSSTNVPIEIVATDANVAPSCFQGPGGWPPVIAGQATSVGALECQDAEGDEIAIEVATPPSHGTAENSGFGPGGIRYRSVLYTPSDGFVGADSLTIRAVDTRGGQTATFSVSITVQEWPSVSAPFCLPVSAVTVLAGRTTKVQRTCAGSGVMGLEIVQPPAHGTLKVPGWLEYTPNVGFTGSDSFSYRFVTSGGSTPVIVQPLSVVSSVGNTSPQCSVWLPGRFQFPRGLDSVPVVRAGETANVSVWCYEADADAVSVQLADPAHGVIGALVPHSPLERWIGFEGSSTYTPDSGFTGFDRLTLTANDGNGGTVSASTDFVVRSASYNTAPWCDSIGQYSFVMIAGTEGTYDEYCTDGEGDPVRLEIVRAPTHVTFAGLDSAGRLAATGSLVRAPANFVGTDSFEMRPIDDRGARGGLYGRGMRVIADPGTFDKGVAAGDYAGAGQYELPTPGRPANVRLQTLNSGRVKIDAKNGTAPAGWSAFGLSFDITAPDATAAAPLELRFRFDASLRAAGEQPGAITVFRNGTAVVDCTEDGARPDPCVASRSELRTGDMEIVVRSSKASTWSFGRTVPGAGPVGPTQGNGSGAGVPTGGAGSSTVLGGQPPRQVAPTLALLGSTRVAGVLKRGLRFVVTADSDGPLRGTLTLGGATAKRLGLSKGKPVVVGTVLATVKAGKPTTVVLRLTPRARKAFARAVRIKLTAEFRVAGGPVSRLPVTLKR